MAETLLETRLETDTSSESDRGQFHNGGWSTEVIYSSSNKDCNYDFRDNWSRQVVRESSEAAEDSQSETSCRDGIFSQLALRIDH